MMTEAEKSALDQIATDWERMIHELARPVPRLEQLPLFNQKDRIVAAELGRKLYPRLLPFGDHHVDKNIDLIERVIYLKKYESPLAFLALSKWKKVKNYYYVCVPLPENSAMYKTLIQVEQGWKNAGAEQYREELEFVKLMKLGLPDIAANFQLKCHFVMVKHGTTTTRDRMVQIKNVYGEETDLIALPAEPYSTPSKLRIWLANVANATWRKGEREWQNLQMDVDFFMKGQDVEQLPAFGWHAKSKYWFFRDCGIRPGATLAEAIMPKDEKEGVIWTVGQGYILWSHGADNQTWRQSQGDGVNKDNPSMHPEIPGIVEEGNGEPAIIDTPSRRLTGSSFTAGPVEDNRAIGRLFYELVTRLRRSYGTDEVQQAIGATLAFAAGPELFERFSGFPGVFIHGPTYTGKSTLARLLMEIWGFHEMGDGIGLQSGSTVTGLLIAAEQYANLPLMLNEYKEGQGFVEPEKIAVVHAMYNREAPSKWNAGGEMRKIRTNAIVCGEHTISNAATKSRYVHVQCSRVRWTAAENQMGWFEKHKRLLFVIGRRLLMKRPEFVKALDRHYKLWSDNYDVLGLPERNKVTHGPAYAAFAAACEILEVEHAIDASIPVAVARTAAEIRSTLEDYLDGVRHSALKHCAEQAEHVSADVNINRVWDDIMTMAISGEYDLRTIFHLSKKTETHTTTPGNETQVRNWTSYNLYLHPANLENALKEHLRHRGDRVTLTKNDMHDQMAKDPAGYWVTGNHVQRFGHGAGNTRCWCLAVDKHPKGLQAVSDIEWKARMAPDGGGVANDDPREGELFYIINKLRAPEKDEGK